MLPYVNMYSIYRKKGFTLLESVIALGLAMIALAAIMLSYNHDKRNAEQLTSSLALKDGDSC